MYSDKAIRAMITKEIPKPRITREEDMTKVRADVVAESVEFRLSVEEIDAKIAKLKADGSPDALKDIKELEAAKKRILAKQKNESMYVEMLTRMSKVQG